ncbi:MAG TPA: VCBS repeat-containing protein, partial [Gemmatimonadaceae bacterium]|nr:VCBS repeat-containing protein [Gemmatimonadaceae bacterium]
SGVAHEDSSGTPAPRPSPPTPLTRAISPFPVLDEHGTPYEHPFLGGFDVPRPQFVDIDGDGDLDLFVQERSNELMFFENTGTRQAPRYMWRTDKYRDLDIGEWSRFADLDGDGDLDLLAELPYSYIRYWRNEGSATAPQFVAVQDSVRDADGRAVFADRQNIPNVADIDCDGLPDLFLGRVDGTITRYELVEGTAGSVPRFRFLTDRFEGIEIIGQIGSMHGANAMYFADIDGDGDLDFFWGDFFEPGVLLIRNVGSCPAPNLRGEPQAIVASGDTISTSGYNVPVLRDIDGDGDLDLFVGVLGGAFNPQRTAADNFLHYERLASGELALRERRYLSAIDVGSESAPALADIDGDGDLDLIVGNKIDPATLDRGRLYLFRNTGTPTVPAFRLEDTLDLVKSYHLAPAFADIDGDGDLDLLVGTWNDGVVVLRNEGTRAAPRFVQDSSLTVRIPRGSQTTPALGDLDGDGDFDLLVGEAAGNLNHFRNDGTRQAPRWTLVTEEYAGIDVGRRSAPALVDLDGDGDLDLVIGREDAGAVVYRNVGSRTEARFELDSTLVVPLHHLGTPAFGDLDGDGRLELIGGGLSGGLVYLRY